MTLPRIIAPAPEHSRTALTAQIGAVMAGLFSFLDFHVIPARPAMDGVLDYTATLDARAETARHTAPAMYRIYARRLSLQVRRFEHTLRCLLLFLANRLLKDPQARASLAPRKSRHRAPRQNPVFNPDDLVQITQPKPRVSFDSLPLVPIAGRHGRGKGPGRHRALQLSDWDEIDISRLMARMARFPKLLQSLDHHAETLAARLISGHIALSEDEIRGPRISRLSVIPSDHPPPRPRYHAPFLRHLSHWLPPPGLCEDCSLDDRDTLDRLHRLAFEALPACAIR